MIRSTLKRVLRRVANSGPRIPAAPDSGRTPPTRRASPPPPPEGDPAPEHAAHAHTHAHGDCDGHDHGHQAPDASGAADDVNDDVVDPDDPDQLECEGAQVAEWIAQGQSPLLVDIREPYELAQGFATGAFLIPMNDVPARVSELPRDRPLVVYCAAGVRSFGVAHWLREQGYPESYSLVGGLGGWLATGAPWSASQGRAPLRLLQPVQFDGRSGTIQDIQPDEGGRWRVALALPSENGGFERREDVPATDVTPG